MVGAFIPSGGGAHWALLIRLITFASPWRWGSSSTGRTLAFHPASYQVATLGFSFSLQVDAIGPWLAILTAFLTPLAIGFSFGSIQEREPNTTRG